MDHRSCLRVLPRPSCLALLKMWKSNQARYLVVHTASYIALHSLSVDKALKLMVVPFEGDSNHDRDSNDSRGLDGVVW